MKERLHDMTAPVPHRPMRRAEREVTDPATLDSILQAAQVLFLALRDEPAPYVLPLCFGYENGVIYVHSAAAGTKIDLIARDPLVGFSASTEMRVIAGETACRFSATARSVVGTGRAEILTEASARRHALDLIVRHYAGHGTPWHSTGHGTPRHSAGHGTSEHSAVGKASSMAVGAPPTYEPASLSRTCVIAVRVQTVRGKSIGEAVAGRVPMVE